MNRIRVLLVWIAIGAGIGAGIGCSSTAPRSTHERRPGPFIAVMAAYPPEIEANQSVLGEQGTRGATWKIDGIVFQHVRFAGHDLLLFPSGVSMVNAAMNTQKALDHFRDILTALDQVRARGLAVILVAHAKVERFEDPEHPAYDRHSPRLHKDASALVCEWVDGIFFATRRTATRTSDEKSGKRVLATSVGKDGAERVLRVNGSPACVAKNRFGLQGDLPLSWKSFVEALA